MPKKFTVVQKSGQFFIQELSPEGRGKGRIEATPFANMKVAQEALKTRKRRNALAEAIRK